MAQTLHEMFMDLLPIGSQGSFSSDKYYGMDTGVMANLRYSDPSVWVDTSVVPQNETTLNRTGFEWFTDTVGLTVPPTYGNRYNSAPNDLVTLPKLPSSNDLLSIVVLGLVGLVVLKKL